MVEIQKPREVGYMNKLRRFFAIILTIVLVAGNVSISALADDYDEFWCTDSEPVLIEMQCAGGSVDFDKEITSSFSRDN